MHYKCFKQLVAALLGAALALPSAAVFAQPSSKGDEALLEMNQAYKRLDRKKLAALLPQVKGHSLEVWGAYWDIKARLDDTAKPGLASKPLLLRGQALGRLFTAFILLAS